MKAHPSCTTRPSQITILPTPHLGVVVQSSCTMHYGSGSLLQRNFSGRMLAESTPPLESTSSPSSLELSLSHIVVQNVAYDM